MTFKLLLKSFAVIGSAIFVSDVQAQKPVNWTSKQLMEPYQLAASIAHNKEVPTIISVGPGATILGSVDVGMVNNEEGIEKLKTSLQSISKNNKIVIYCGCCPFEHCPNVRPAIEALKALNFENYFLLNIPNNIKKDWIDKGYPIKK